VKRLSEFYEFILGPKLRLLTGRFSTVWQFGCRKTQRQNIHVKACRHTSGEITWYKASD